MSACDRMISPLAGSSLTRASRGNLSIGIPESLHGIFELAICDFDVTQYCHAKYIAAECLFLVPVHFFRRGLEE